MLLENELELILAQNVILRLLIRKKYRWALLAIALAIGYFIIGVGIAMATHTLTAFLQSRFVYVLLLAIVACVTAACWYPTALVEVIAVVPHSFKVEPEIVTQIVTAWIKLIQLPIPISFGLFLAASGISLSLAQQQLLGLPANLPTLLLIYGRILLAVCSLMLGGGVVVFLATMVLYRQLFRFELRLSHYRNLAPLSTFCAGLTLLAFIAVALLLLLVFDQLRPSSIIVAILGLVGGCMMFVVAQYSYQSAVVRAKRLYLNQLAPLYEQYYRAAIQNTSDTEALQATQKSLEALDAIEKNVQSIPVWLIELSDIVKVAWSSLLPIGSLIINPILSRLGFQ